MGFKCYIQIFNRFHILKRYHIGVLCNFLVFFKKNTHTHGGSKILWDLYIFCRSKLNRKERKGRERERERGVIVKGGLTFKS